MASSHAASNAVVQARTMAGSVVRSWSSTWPSPEKCVKATVSSSNSQKSLPGNNTVDARRRGSHRTSSPALTKVEGVQPLKIDVLRDWFGHDAQAAQGFAGRTVGGHHLEPRPPPLGFGLFVQRLAA